MRAETASVILPRFFAQEDRFGNLVTDAAAVCRCYLLGRWRNRRWRYDRVAAAQRLLQLKALSLELRSLRSKVLSAQGLRTPPAKRRLVRKLPTLKWWQRRLIAWLRLRIPWLTRFMRFSPGTYIRWLQARSRAGHARKTAEGKARGRPPTPQFIVDAILAIQRDSLRYSAGHIARMISGGKLKFRISKKAVAQILKSHGFKPRPKGKRPPRKEESGWLTTLYNQHVMAIDSGLMSLTPLMSKQRDFLQHTFAETQNLKPVAFSTALSVRIVGLPRLDSVR